MYNGKRIIGIIPARGGSKGLPRKNVLPLGGKPLIAWTIEEAKKSRYLDRLILSSEDSEIVRIAKGWDCEVPFMRPLELAMDDTPGIEPVLHAINTLPEKYDYILLLQPTSPLRIVEDIDGCIEKCINEGAKACVSVTEPEKSPYWMYSIDSKDILHPLIKTEENIVRRQDLPKVYALNGALYIADCNWLLNTKTFLSPETIGYKMPKERSVDIDSDADFRFAEFLMSQLAESCKCKEE